MRKPNLFIVGAPKSGTTALNDFLNQHPDIFMAKKEIHYFGSDLNIRQPALSEEEYFSFFKEGGNKKILGEASVWYLFSQRAANEIKQFSPAAKIIIMLRNPLDMLYALHQQNIHDGNEDVTDFQKALVLEEERTAGKQLPRQLEILACLLYTDVGKYYAQVKRYLDTFGRGNVHIILYDDFQEDNLAAYAAVLKFLNVSKNFTPAISVINPNKKIKSPLIQQTIKRPPSVLQTIFRILLPYRPARHAMMKKFTDWNVTETEREEMSPALRQQLIKEFTNDIEQLGKLLQRDLTCWLKS